MRKSLSLAAVSLTFGLFGFTVTGCAEDVEAKRDDARVHEYRAQQAAAYGDYRRAAQEQQAAQRDLAEANRAQWEEEHEGQPYPQQAPVAAPATQYGQPGSVNQPYPQPYNQPLYGVPPTNY